MYIVLTNGISKFSGKKEEDMSEVLQYLLKLLDFPPNFPLTWTSLQVWIFQI